LLFLCGAFAPGLAVAQSVAVSYEPTAGRIGVRAQDASLGELLSGIAAKTGITIEVDSRVAQERVSVERDGVPLDRFMHEFLRRYSYVLYYDNRHGTGRIVSVIVLSRGVPSGGSLVLTTAVNEPPRGPDSEEMPASLRGFRSATQP